MLKKLTLRLLFAFPPTISLCVLGVPAKAETVLVSLSDKDFGHGWMFVDPKHKTCRLAVPAHVITKGSGLVAPYIKTDEGRSYLTENPKKVPGLDLAIVELVAADPLTCARARPLFSNEVSRLRTLKSAWLEHFVGGEEFASSKVKILSRTLENAEEAKFIIEPDDEQSAFMKGMSGSMVYGEDRSPLGMLIEVDGIENYGVVMRFDAIRNAIRATPPSDVNRTSNASTRWEAMSPQENESQNETISIPGTYPLSSLKITGFSGTPLSPQTGPTNILQSNSAIWQTQTEKRSAFVSVAPISGKMPVSRVVVQPGNSSIDNRSNLKRLIIHGAFADVTSGPWSYITACEPLTSGPLFDCRVFNKRTKAMKLSFVTENATSTISVGTIAVYK